MAARGVAAGRAIASAGSGLTYVNPFTGEKRFKGRYNAVGTEGFPPYLHQWQTRTRQCKIKGIDGWKKLGDKLCLPLFPWTMSPNADGAGNLVPVTYVPWAMEFVQNMFNFYAPIYEEWRIGAVRYTARVMTKQATTSASGAGAAGSNDEYYLGNTAERLRFFVAWDRDGWSNVEVNGMTQEAWFFNKRAKCRWGGEVLFKPFVAQLTAMQTFNRPAGGALGSFVVPFDESNPGRWLPTAYDITQTVPQGANVLDVRNLGWMCPQVFAVPFLATVPAPATETPLDPSITSKLISYADVDVELTISVCMEFRGKRGMTLPMGRDQSSVTGMTPYQSLRPLLNGQNMTAVEWAPIAGVPDWTVFAGRETAAMADRAGTTESQLGLDDEEAIFPDTLFDASPTG